VFQLLEVLKNEGFLSHDEFVSLRRTCRDLKENQVRILRSLNILTQNQIQAVFAEAFRVEALTEQILSQLSPNQNSLIPKDVCIYLGVLPIGLSQRTWKTLPPSVSEHRETLKVAMEDPSDIGNIHKLKFFVDHHITPLCATADQIARGLKKIFFVDHSQTKLQTVLEKGRGTHPFIANIGQTIEFANPVVEIDAEIARRIATASSQRHLSGSQVFAVSDTSNPSNEDRLALAAQKESHAAAYAHQLLEAVNNSLPKMVLLNKSKDMIELLNDAFGKLCWKFENTESGIQVSFQNPIEGADSIKSWHLANDTWPDSVQKIGIEAPVFLIVTPVLKQLMKRKKGELK
jgi:hypothetical protein